MGLLPDLIGFLGAFVGFWGFFKGFFCLFFLLQMCSMNIALGF